MAGQHAAGALLAPTLALLQAIPRLHSGIGGRAALAREEGRGSLGLQPLDLLT